MDEQPTEEDFDLSVFSFYEWRQLGEQLQVSAVTLNDIAYRHQTFQKKKATRETLLAWVQEKGSAATRRALIDALVSTNKAEFIHAAAVYRAHIRTYAHRVGTGPQHPAEDEDEEGGAEEAVDETAAGSGEEKGKKKKKDKKGKKKGGSGEGSGEGDRERLIKNGDADLSDADERLEKKKMLEMKEGGGSMDDETGKKKGSGMGDLHCLDVCRGMLRIILVIVNVIVAILGLLVLVVGIWALVSNNVYFDIVADEKEITQIPWLMIVVGSFVLLLGVVGVIGAICAGTIGGRIILGLYGFALALLVICELAGGIAAGVLSDQLDSSFEESASSSFKKYLQDASIQDAWNTAQEQLECCGNNNYTDYGAVFNNDSVPVSCCNESTIDESKGGPDCDAVVVNATKYSSNIYSEGCTSKVEDFFSRNLSVIAGVSIFFGLLQIVGVVMSCFVAIVRRSESDYIHV